MTHTMAILDRTGHTEVRWDIKDADAVKEAERIFNETRTKGYAAYQTDSATTGTLIREFNPQADIVLAPQIAGG